MTDHAAAIALQARRGFHLQWVFIALALYQVGAVATNAHMTRVDAASLIFLGFLLATNARVMYTNGKLLLCVNASPPRWAPWAIAFSTVSGISVILAGVYLVFR